MGHSQSHCKMYQLYGTNQSIAWPPPYEGRSKCVYRFFNLCPCVRKTLIPRLHDFYKEKGFLVFLQAAEDGSNSSYLLVAETRASVAANKGSWRNSPEIPAYFSPGATPLPLPPWPSSSSINPSVDNSDADTQR
jgi:hypothetical protein